MKLAFLARVILCYSWSVVQSSYGGVFGNFDQVIYDDFVVLTM